MSRARAFSPLSASASSIQASIRSRVTGSPAATRELQVEQDLPQGEHLAQDRAMGLGRPLGQDGLEQHVTDPFADPLIAGELFQQRVVILASPSC